MRSGQWNKYRKLKRYRKVGGSADRTKWLLRQLTSQLIMQECIHTKFRAAQLLSREMDKLITMAKKRTYNAKRRIDEFVYTEVARKKLFWHLYKRFDHLDGGYTRVLKAPKRERDNTPMGIVEFVDTLQTVLEPEELLLRKEKKERRKSYRRGLGAYGLATALPPTPGTEPERGIFRSIRPMSDAESERAERARANAPPTPATS